MTGRERKGTELPPYEHIRRAPDWQACLEKLRQEPRLAIDLEANSMFAYQERICLIQISTPQQDYIIDPTRQLDLSGLGELIEDPAVEKIFHAAEYDLILLKREFGWKLNNLFDTMWAARILGYQRYGLASLLEDLYGVRLNKRYQKSNWCKRPLSPAQLTYAQHDTHHLFRLRDHLARELSETGRAEEAAETFAAQTHVQLPNISFDTDSFWSVSGAYDLTPQQQAVLKAVSIYRDEEARRRDQPHFKVFGDRTMMGLAQRMPANLGQLAQVHGMTKGQIRRYGRRLLRVIAEAKQAPPPNYPKRRNKRVPEVVVARYERLHTWRKRRAQARGVESDVIISRDALWEIAHANPRSQEELGRLSTVGSWRCATYGGEILKVLNEHDG